MLYCIYGYKLKTSSVAVMFSISSAILSPVVFLFIPLLYAYGVILSIVFLHFVPFFLYFLKITGVGML